MHVRGVRPGGPADEAEPALENDDVVVEIDGKRVKASGGAQRAGRRADEGQAEPVAALVAFDRGRQRMLTVLEVGRPGLEDPGLETRKAWVPVSVQVLTPQLAEKLGLAGRTGVRVTRVMGGSGGRRGTEGRRHRHRNRRRPGRGVAAVRRGPVRHDDPAIQDRQRP